MTAGTKFISAVTFVAVSLVAVSSSPAVADPADEKGAESRGVTTVTTPARTVFGPSDPNFITWTAMDGKVHFARALQPDEIVARGLNKNAPNAEIRVVAPTVVKATAAKSPVVPTQKPSNAIAPAGVGILSCWDDWWYQGWSGGGGLHGRTELTWCSDGTWITDVWKNCFGIDGGYPSYEFLSCTMSETYGVNWSAWDVKTVLQLCDAWIPLWGTCGHTRTFWAKFRHGAQGQIVELEWHLG
ncbi:hypothetical protein [Catelliglobosispora koreensis]|uniref:hypothetical protein n=1 Tax=Catelliglobosispora koreensis TaxID=129052 RepID=UPI0003716EA1|nr:hypothetical protein [Catelliglobosispora koreensis]